MCKNSRHMEALMAAMAPSATAVATWRTCFTRISPAAARELEAGTLAWFDLAGLPMSGSFCFVCLKDNIFAANWMDWMV